MERSTKTACERLASRAGGAPVAGRNGAAGFTLIELLVAVGAIAILSVGIASIFSAIGKTVSGGRRISQLTAQAAQIEVSMRQDFARMTRDGFMMVRQQLTNTGGPRGGPRPVKLNAAQADSEARLRRIDEVLFFAKGEFTSSREPVDAVYEVRAEAARIYYGHGTRQMDNGEPKPPALTDYNSVAGVLGGGATQGNRYAGEWTLVRHQCLLVDPRQTRYDFKPVLGLNPAVPQDALLMADKDGQVGLQPAGMSVFRHLAPIPQNQPPSGPYKPDWLRPGTRRMASGLIDTVTQTLRDVREVVVASRRNPAQLLTGPSWFTTVGPDLAGSSFVLDQTANPPFPSAFRMQLWMDSAWPMQSDQTRAPAFEPMLSAYSGIPGQVATGGRIRVEPKPPHLLEVMRGDGKFNSTVDRTAADYRVDQLQLAANGFLRGCTEFIVDWSLGEADPLTGELVWYGLPRFADLDADQTQDATEPWLTRPYPFRPDGTAPDGSAGDPEFTFPYYTSSGVYVDGTKAAWGSNNGGVTVTDHVMPELIYGAPAPTAATTNMCMTSFFGYEDPTGALGRPWVWPEFVRITIKLIDPQDATTEQTYQFVFKAPGNGGQKL